MRRAWGFEGLTKTRPRQLLSLTSPSPQAPHEGTTMATVLEEKDAIRELLAGYCFHFDNGEFEEWVNLFTDDGVFDLGTRGRFAGRDALRAFVHLIPLTNGLPGMRHYVTNSIVGVDGDRATARCYVVV